MPADEAVRRIAIIGFGEAGGILGEDLAAAGVTVTTYDILLDAAATRAQMLSKAQRAHVRPARSLAEGVGAADLVISAVTAASSTEVACAAGANLRAGQMFLDINSVSPETKRSNARAVERSGADYVEAAVMASVPPQRLAVPMLLGGRGAEVAAQRLRALGMNATAFSTQVGTASAVKMCRSVMIKGLEALTVESMLAARRYGVEAEVLRSLARTFPHMGWQDARADYFISRVAQHGRRRAAEMREVARTLREVGLDPLMAAAAASRQDALVDAMQARGLRFDDTTAFAWRALADALAVTPAEAPAASAPAASAPAAEAGESGAGRREF